MPRLRTVTVSTADGVCQQSIILLVCESKRNLQLHPIASKLGYRLPLRHGTSTILTTVGVRILCHTCDAVQASIQSIASLFASQQKHVNYFFDHVDYDAILAFVQLVLGCTGTVFCTGVIKCVAKKVSMTLVSTGTRSAFLSPSDALYGDIGMVYRGDLVVIFSKTGASESIISLLPGLRAKGAKTVAVTSTPTSRLQREADLHIYLPLLREACPFNLEPVTSSTLQLVFGDTVAVALMAARGFTREQYAVNHPAGTIGRRLALKAADVMRSGAQLPLCAPGAVLVDMLVELSEKGCGCLIVVKGLAGRDGEVEKGEGQEGGEQGEGGKGGEGREGRDRGGKAMRSEVSEEQDGTDEGKGRQLAEGGGIPRQLLGVFTDGDLRRAICRMGKDAVNTKVSELMTTSPRFICAGGKAIDAMNQMVHGHQTVTFLPVVDSRERKSVVGHVAGASLTAGYTADRAERTKLLAYGDVGHHRVVPFVLEEFGAMGPLTSAFFKECCRLREDRLDLEGQRAPWSARTWTSYWRQRLSVALTRAMADIMLRRTRADFAVQQGY
eukprot:jgi/Mesvir1/13018/Mv06017-RA.1